LVHDAQRYAVDWPDSADLLRQMTPRSADLTPRRRAAAITTTFTC